MPQILFATESYQSPSLPLSAQRLVNMYLEVEPPDAKTQTPVWGSPGLAKFATAGVGPIRGGRAMNGLLYVVSGTELYSVTAAGVAVRLPGPAINGNLPVSVTDNNTQFCVVAGMDDGAGYIYSVAAGLQKITSANYLPARTVTFYDDYFVFAPQTGTSFFNSALLDGLTFNGLDQGQAAVQPGACLNVIENHETLMIVCENAIETWYDAGTFPFPFQRYDGATIERGTAAAQSVVKEDNTIFFLGDDLIFYRVTGDIPIRISTHAIEAAWRKYATVADCVAGSYTVDGHKCIVLTFPTANASWLCDLAAGNRWHERESWNAQNVSLSRWRANCFFPAFGKALAGDAFDGTIGVIDPDTYTEYGNTIRGLAITPPVHADRKRVSHICLELDIEAGVGLAAGQGSDPQVMMDFSDDGGRTFGKLQKWRSLGKQGEYTKRARWNKLGQARQRVYRFQVTDPVRRRFLALHLDSEVRV